MAAGWYVLHTYSGYENKIERIIRLMLESGDLNKDIVKDIKIPQEDVVEVKEGKKRTQKRKFFPGYVLVELDLPEDISWKETCSKIKKIQGVAGFVGTPAGKRPQPLSGDEARSILQKSGENIKI